MIDLLVMGAALSAAVAAAVAASIAVPPPAPLRRRLHPYIGLVPAEDRAGTGRSLRDATHRVARVVDASSDEAISRRLRQARLLAGVPQADRVAVLRMRQLGTVVAGLAGATSIGLATGRSTPLVLLLGILGIAWGATFWRGKIDAAIEERRSRLRIELYTIDQVLAMRIRAGSGVVGAMLATVRRHRGEVVADLEEALRLHRSGVAAGEALRRVADVCPEPHAQRTYRLLATAQERGSDLADALLALADDVRDDRREALRRSATRRRAAMLLPIIGLLAPVLVMFVAAPLPWIVFGELR